MLELGSGKGTIGENWKIYLSISELFPSGLIPVISMSQEQVKLSGGNPRSFLYSLHSEE